MKGQELNFPKIPSWFLATFGVMRHVDRGLRKLDTYLLRTEALEGLDPRLRARIQDVRTELWAAHAGLTRMDVEAGEILKQILREQAA